MRVLEEGREKKGQSQQPDGYVQLRSTAVGGPSHNVQQKPQIVPVPVPRYHEQPCAAVAHTLSHTHPVRGSPCIFRARVFHMRCTVYTAAVPPQTTTVSMFRGLLLDIRGPGTDGCRNRNFPHSGDEPQPLALVPDSGGRYVVVS